MKKHLYYTRQELTSHGKWEFIEHCLFIDDIKTINTEGGYDNEGICITL